MREDGFVLVLPAELGTQDSGLGTQDSGLKKNGPITGATFRGNEMVGNVRKGDAWYRSASQNGVSGSDAKQRE